MELRQFGHASRSGPGFDCRLLSIIQYLETMIGREINEPRSIRRYIEDTTDGDHIHWGHAWARFNLKREERRQGSGRLSRHIRTPKAKNSRRAE
jgi:hypothetical protein